MNLISPPFSRKNSKLGCWCIILNRRSLASFFRFLSLVYLIFSPFGQFLFINANLSLAYMRSSSADADNRGEPSANTPIV
ncbi:hypothetical protein BDQ12DRAFT_727153 [Crucibulum laeve]|uniref:Uncharacterized protein n=1 Tax=Crucibulum laeve TaxID=68775 RepID=A0A5C3LQ25_9AGAR|nr:hypothetical protein BDQ12DRAFT_727153 [Crucibulum laeve]